MDIMLAFTITVLSASFIAVILKKAGISPIAGYIATGLIVGPLLHLIDPSNDIVVFFSEIGIALICFQIGFTMKLGFLRRMGSLLMIISTSMLMIIGLAMATFGIIIALPSIAIFVLILISCGSSTSIVFKILERKGILQSEQSKLTLGSLTVEDILQLIGLSLLPSFAVFSTLQIEEGMYKISFVVFVVLIVFVIGIKLLPRIINFVSRCEEDEVLTLCLLGVTVGFGWLSYYIGVSFAIGAFMAGIICSTLEIPECVTRRISAISELFIVIFFISIGLNMPRLDDLALVLSSLGIALAIIATKFIAFSGASILGGFRIKEAFRYGIFMMVISEFGLIISREAYRLQIIGEPLFIASPLAVIISAFLASKLSEDEEKPVELLLRFIPSRTLSTLEGASASLRRLISNGMKQGSPFNAIVFSIFKKTVSVVVIGTIGSILMQAILVLNTPFTFVFELIILATIIMLSALVILSLRADIGQFSYSLASGDEAKSASRLNSALKGFMESLVILALAAILSVNAFYFIRALIPSGLEITGQNFLIFALILLIVVASSIPILGKIMGILREIERVIDSL